MRYAIHSPDMLECETDTAQRAGDACFEIIESGYPCAYYHDRDPRTAYPYVVYQRVPMGGWTGDAFPDKARALAFVDAIHEAHACSHPLPVSRHTFDVRQLAILRDPMTITREAP